MCRGGLYGQVALIGQVAFMDRWLCVEVVLWTGGAV